MRVYNRWEVIEAEYEESFSDSSKSGVISNRRFLTWGYSLGYGFGGVIQGDEGPELSADMVFVLGRCVDEGLDSKVVEQTDMIWEYIHSEVVPAFVFPW